MIIGGKISTAILWVLCIYNYILPMGGIFELILFWMGIFLVVAHAIEMFVFMPTAKKAPGPLAGHMLQLFLFGYVHKMAMDKMLIIED